MSHFVSVLKTVLLILVLVLYFYLIQSVQAEIIDPNSLALIPKPQIAEWESGCFTLTKKVNICIEDDKERLDSIAEFLSVKIAKNSNFKPKVRTTNDSLPEKNTILLTTKSADVMLGSEGYELFVYSDRVMIRAQSPAGIWYGVQTLRQMMPIEIDSKVKLNNKSWQIPCCKIYDKPAFVWRGFLLDSCRHFQDIDTIKQIIDLMGYYKLNVFRWNLTEDEAWRIEIKKYPQLTQKGAWRLENGKTYGGFYTQKQARDIVRYAKERFITVVPGLEMPGHCTAAIYCYPELSCSQKPFEGQDKGNRGYFYNAVGRQAYCTANEDTLGFNEDVITELLSIFDSPYIALGGDERPEGQWSKCPRCQAKMKELGFANRMDRGFDFSIWKREPADANMCEAQLQYWYMNQINEFVLSKNRRPTSWVADYMQYDIPDRQIVEGWNNFSEVLNAVNKGHETLFNSLWDVYLIFPYSKQEKLDHKEWPEYYPVIDLQKIYSFSPISQSLTYEQSKKILGSMACLWTEDTPQEMVFKRTFPRLIAFSEAVWLSQSEKNWDEFKYRMFRHYRRLDQMKLDYVKLEN
ncbi:MAG: beta-N-acetylhexosaminidase [Sedimentisphaerales bacterium]